VEEGDGSVGHIVKSTAKINYSAIDVHKFPKFPVIPFCSK